MDDGVKIREQLIHDRIAELKLEHSDIQESIIAIMNDTGFDQLLVQRLKKRKLAIKDQIRLFEDLLIPDIIA
jgi:hypothetical protein